MHKFDNSLQCSDSWFDVSAKEITNYWTCDGDLVLNWKDRGYKTLFDLLSVCIFFINNDYLTFYLYNILFIFFQQKISTIKNNLSIIEKVEFNKNVDNINYISNDNIIVKTKDNSKYIASHVIFTASLGVLKEKHMTMFTPLLPERKQNAIKARKSLMLMSNIKICLFFDMHLI